MVGQVVYSTNYCMIWLADFLHDPSLQLVLDLAVCSRTASLMPTRRALEVGGKDLTSGFKLFTHVVDLEVFPASKLDSGS